MSEPKSRVFVELKSRRKRTDTRSERRSRAQKLETDGGRYRLSIIPGAIYTYSS